MNNYFRSGRYNRKLKEAYSYDRRKKELLDERRKKEDTLLSSLDDNLFLLAKQNISYEWIKPIGDSALEWQLDRMKNKYSYPAMMEVSQWT